MRIVRTLWSRTDKILSEIPKTPLEDELVLTFEIENYNYLKSLNYEVIKVDERLKVNDFFLNKLILLNQISKEEDFIFLDWDIRIDDIENVKQLIKERKFNVPLYSYPPLYYEDVKITESTSAWFKNHKFWTNELNVWRLPDRSYVLPCFCCFTNIKNETIIPELVKIGEQLNFNSCSEEFSFFYYIKENHLVDSLDEYLKKIEPLFIFGREKNYVHNFLDYSYNTLNAYIEKKIKKIPTLKHL